MTVLLGLLLATGALAQTPAHDAALLEAVMTEVGRATQSLTMEGYPPPYFMTVRVTDEDEGQFSYSLGQPLEHYRYSTRTLTPDVRVGGYELDDHPLEPASDVHSVSLPLSDDVYSLRYRLWTALDEEYKLSAANFLRKQALRVDRGKADYETDDNTREKPAVSPFAPPPEPFDNAPWEAATRDASAAFRANPILLYSWINFRHHRHRELIVNSEGTRVSFPGGYVTLAMAAGSYADDGMRLNCTRQWTAPGPKDLPGAEELKREALLMQAELMDLRQAASTSPFNAPAILDPSASAALFSALATRLEGEEQRNPEGSQTFKSQMGKRITPTFLSFYDDPSAAVFGKEPLAGHYPFDDEGVTSRRAVLIDKGVLKGFLLSRYPVVGFSHSTGHGRAGSGHAPMARFANLFVKSDKTVSLAQLKKMLMAECRKRGKTHGLWVKHVSRWRQQTGTQEHQAFRASPELVYLVDAKTGQETLVRGVDVVDTPLVAASKLLAAADDSEVTNYIDDQASGSVPVGVVSPSLLLAEIETQRSEGKPERPPILPPPKP